MDFQPIKVLDVSSLYGRVYREYTPGVPGTFRFLPIWEGVSNLAGELGNWIKFPPYTGGCIGQLRCPSTGYPVFSLYGSVYRGLFEQS